MNKLQLSETPHWITIAHLPKWRTEQKNRLIVKIFHERESNFEEFFSLTQSEWIRDFGLTKKETYSLEKAKEEIPNNSFYAEDLISQGFEVIPINSKEFSNTLKKNLKVKHTPPVIYAKGNKQLLLENSIAIVGSRKASKTSLDFTDSIAKKASKEYKVVVSGFAKGVDRQALDSALKYNGQSIIVLPQGITTFKSGFKKYYKEIVEGNLLVLSTFHPRAKWSVGLAMARNPIIYGLANEIYVAESSQKGGTWEGVQDGLKKGRTIYVRYPNPKEKNANLLLIQKGAVGVDFKGDKVINGSYSAPEPVIEKLKEPATTPIKKEVELDNNSLFDLLKENAFSSKEIIKKLQLDWSSRKMTSYLKKLENIEVLKSKPLKFQLKNNSIKTLF
ncbi:DNA-processing protein DprA [Phaeodactylibacter luteus]|uniref:DNA-processing protein DprA n=1 Tax=Phaeodactylibacter luteus TaxID=1564516 RepID=A0A5C6RJR0_9BACT|nr:DNA-processing protein DprA [Phaeodactylibacter luteus]TXB62149.1 DNA-processing protein DprA [Phaeodactylibacter luteus]